MSPLFPGIVVTSSVAGISFCASCALAAADAADSLAAFCCGWAGGVGCGAATWHGAFCAFAASCFNFVRSPGPLCGSRLCWRPSSLTRVFCAVSAWASLVDSDNTYASPHLYACVFCLLSLRGLTSCSTSNRCLPTCGANKLRGAGLFWLTACANSVTRESFY